MRVLVVYASKHGSTAEIAEFISDRLRRSGHSVACKPAQETDSVVGFEAVVVGSAIYMQRWLKDARKFLSRTGGQLADRQFWVFSSGPCGAAADQDAWDTAEPQNTMQKVEQLGAVGHVVFGGRIPTEPSNFVERSIAKNTPTDLRDLRDWDAIELWAAEIASELQLAESREP